MAWTTFGFRGQYATVNDGETILAVYFLIREIRCGGKEVAGLEPWCADWEDSIIGQGPGIFDPSLDKHLTSDAAVEAFLALLERAENRLIQDFGDTVPADYLNREVPPSGFDFYDYPSARIVRAMHNLRDLVHLGLQEGREPGE